MILVMPNLLLSGQMCPCPCLQPVHTGPVPTVLLNPGLTGRAGCSHRSPSPAKLTEPSWALLSTPHHLQPRSGMAPRPRPEVPQRWSHSWDWAADHRQGEVSVSAVPVWAAWAGDPHPETQQVSGRAECGVMTATLGAWPVGDAGKWQGYWVWGVGTSAGLGGSWWEPKRQQLPGPWGSGCH